MNHFKIAKQIENYIEHVGGSNLLRNNLICFCSFKNPIFDSLFLSPKHCSASSNSDVVGVLELQA